jgi:hypothetical protein
MWPKGGSKVTCVRTMKSFTAGTMLSRTGSFSGNAVLAILSVSFDTDANSKRKIKNGMLSI